MFRHILKHMSTRMDCHGWCVLVSALYFAGEQWGGVAYPPGVGGAECLTLAQNLASNFAAFEPEQGVEHVHRGGRIGYCRVRVRIVQSQAVKECGQVVGATVKHLLGKVNGVNERKELVLTLIIVDAGHTVKLSNYHFRVKRGVVGK